MAEGLIGAAPVGQPGAGSTSGQGTVAGGQQMVGGGQGQLSGQDSNQPQVSYVTSEQLDAAMDRIERMFQSRSDKSYNKVQKMIEQMQQAGIKNPTADQARAMLAATGQSEQQGQDQPEAQGGQSAAASPEAEAWIKANGGDVTQGFWNDIYDVAQEAGVGMITRDDPEFTQFFTENGQLKKFAKGRHMVRAFEQAFEAKKQRLGNGTVPSGTVPGNMASSPALGSGGAKSTYRDPKTVDRSDLISAGLREPRRR